MYLMCTSRVLVRYRSDATRLAEKLVYGYPSHEYIIDYQELKDLGFNVELFSEEEAEAAQPLMRFAQSEEKIVKVVVPTADGEPEADEKAEVESAETATNGKAKEVQLKDVGN